MSGRKGEGHIPYIELSGERRLIEGQDFNNQPPFAGILRGVATSSGIPLPQLSTRIWGQARYNTLGERQGPYDIGVGLAQIAEQQLQGLKLTFERERHHRNLRRIRFLERTLGELKAKHTILEELQIYPWWTTYVKNTLFANPGYYSSDGTFKNRTKLFVPPKTYIEWGIEHAESQKRLAAADIQVVLREVFPQDLAGEAIEEVIGATGQKRTTRNIRIMQAGEIFPQ